MKATAVCQSVEGERLLLRARKFIAQIPFKDPQIGQIVYPFKLGIASVVCIEVELSPKVAKWSATSLLSVEDEIQGETIDGKALKPIGKPVVKRGSGRHKASFAVAKGGSYAHIEIGMRQHLTRLHRNDDLSRE